jgi:hypothetical protein
MLLLLPNPEGVSVPTTDGFSEMLYEVAKS